MVQLYWVTILVLILEASKGEHFSLLIDKFLYTIFI